MSSTTTAPKPPAPQKPPSPKKEGGGFLSRLRTGSKEEGGSASGGGGGDEYGSVVGGKWKDNPVPQSVKDQGDMFAEMRWKAKRKEKKEEWEAANGKSSGDGSSSGGGSRDGEVKPAWKLKQDAERKAQEDREKGDDSSGGIGGMLANVFRAASPKKDGGSDKKDEPSAPKKTWGLGGGKRKSVDGGSSEYGGPDSSGRWKNAFPPAGDGKCL